MTSKEQPKPKRSREKVRAQIAKRLRAIRVKMAIHRALDNRGITTSSGIGAALDLPAADAVKLLKRKVLREGDIEQLVAAMARLGVQDPG